MDSQLATPSDSPPTDPTSLYSIHGFRFHGTGWDLFGIWILNLAKTILTLGLYSFWAKAQTRAYLWGQSEFAGDRFGYHGTGKELLLGWVKAALLFAGLSVINGALAWQDLGILSGMLSAAALFALFAVARIGTMRYRLSRTSWRGIRFSFHGELGPFLLLSLKTQFLTLLTLGLYYPFYDCTIRQYLTDRSAFGTTHFRFDGRGWDLFKMFVAHWAIGVIVIPGIAIASIFGYTSLFNATMPQRDDTPDVAWQVLIPVIAVLLAVALVFLSYQTRRRRYFWNHTLFGDTRVHTTVSPVNLCVLYATNALLLLLTLGLAWPWVLVRTRRFDLEHLSLHGPLDLDSMVQQAQQANATGDELGSFLDVDALPG
jgi:uncharacterized membrane protein YjgN (DUF898 family)